jgi:hypothetical protein
VRLQGIAIFAEAGGRRASEVGQKVAAPVFAALCVKGQERKEAFCCQAFCFFCASKEKAAHAAIEHPESNIVAVIVRYLSQ